MTDTKEQLQKISGLFNTDKIISPEDIQGVLGGIIKILANHKKGTEDMNEENRQVIMAMLEKIVDKHEEHKGTIDKAVTTQLNSHNFVIRGLIDQVNESLEEVKSRVPKDGEPGKDSDPEEVAAIVMKKIKIPKGAKNAILSPVDMANALESLENEDRLSADAIDDDSFGEKIRKAIKSNKGIIKVIVDIAVGGARFLSYLADVAISSPTNGQALVYDSTNKVWKNGTVSGGGGGFNNINEIVSGTGTAFVLANTPIDSTKVCVYGGGSRLYPTLDYTIAGKNITMVNGYATGQVLADYSS